MWGRGWVEWAALAAGPRPVARYGAAVLWCYHSPRGRATPFAPPPPPPCCIHPPSASSAWCAAASARSGWESGPAVRPAPGLPARPAEGAPSRGQEGADARVCCRVSLGRGGGGSRARLLCTSWEGGLRAQGEGMAVPVRSAQAPQRHQTPAPLLPRCLRSMVAQITGTSEFYISLMDHSDWAGAHTVWGKVGRPSLSCSFGWLGSFEL